MARVFSIGLLAFGLWVTDSWPADLYHVSPWRRAPRPDWKWAAALRQAALGTAMTQPASMEQDSLQQGSLRPGLSPSVSVIPDSWFGRDKARHFIGSFLLVGAASRWYGRQAGMGKKDERIVFGMAMTLLLGTAKEAWDGWSGKGRASWKDLAADVLGLLAGAWLLGGW